VVLFRTFFFSEKYLFSTHISIFLRKTSMWLATGPSGLGYLTISIMNPSASRRFMLKLPGAEQILRKEEERV
jgi:hypothetical protein